MKCLKLRGIIQYCYSKLYYETLGLVASVQWEIVSIKFTGPSAEKNCSLLISSLPESHTNTPHHGQDIGDQLQGDFGPRGHQASKATPEECKKQKPTLTLCLLGSSQLYSRQVVP